MSKRQMETDCLRRSKRQFATDCLRQWEIVRQLEEEAETINRRSRDQERAKLEFEKELKSMMDYRKRKWPNSSDILDQGTMN